MLIEKELVNLYRLNKLNVASGAAIKDFNGVNQLIQNYIGLHAARIGKPYISLLSKNIDIPVNELFRKINFSNEFITRRCMRKTLHICHVDDVDMVHIATAKLRVPKIKQDQETLTESERLIREQLEIKAVSREEVYSLLQLRLNIDIDNARTLFNYHYENGLIYFKNIDDNVYKEKRLYYLYDRKLGLVGEDLLQNSVNTLVERYIKNFGPVTLDDICWWSGIAKTRVLKALRKIEDKLSRIEVKGFKEPLYVFESERDNLVLVKRNCLKGQCKFMAYEDSALKAYHNTRCFYTDKEERYFNRIGEIYATIMLEGQCVGVWNLDTNKHIINIEFLDVKSSQYEIVNKEKKRMESLLF